MKKWTTDHVVTKGAHMSNDNKELIDFPESYVGSMSGIPKGGQAVIPEGFKITKCPASRRGIKSKHVTRPRKAGRLITWEVAEALAPDVNLSYDQQEAKGERKFIRSLSQEEAARFDLEERIRKLKKENDSFQED